MKLYLGSQSPRRKELLSSLGYQFEIVSINCEETYPNNLNPSEVAGYLSELKANAFRDMNEKEALITADTIVAIDQQVLGKPQNKKEAKEMLSLLSGKTHQVYTAVTLKTQQETITKTDIADVEFSPISDAEIDFYINNFQPFDKAGAYGIQEWLGMAKIIKITGSFYTIMGLPTHLVYDLLKKLNAV